MGCTSSKHIANPDEPLSIAHLEVMRCLGMGAYGEVNAVRFYFPVREYSATGKHIKEDGMFALKKISKRQLGTKASSLVGTLMEKDLLQAMSTNRKSHFVVKLYGAFQDVKNLYLVLDLMMGGSLRYHLDANSFSTCNSRVLYVASCELVCALQFIHSMGVIHRDIKPGNILLDSNGHLFLTDFNLAYQFDEDVVKKSKKTGKMPRLEKTNLVVGTREYIAPEILLLKPYGFEVDYWSLGVTLYELFFKSTPWDIATTYKMQQDKVGMQENMRQLHGNALDDGFLDLNVAAASPLMTNTNNQFVSDSSGQVLQGPLLRAITKGKILTPKADSEKFKQNEIPFLRGLLKRNPDKRFNSNNVTSSSFLKDTKWKHVKSMKLKPGFTPSRKGVNVDKSHEIIQALSSDNMTSKPKKVLTMEDFEKSGMSADLHIEKFWSWHYNGFRDDEEEEQDPFIAMTEDCLEAHGEAAPTKTHRKSTKLTDRVKFYVADLQKKLTEDKILHEKSSFERKISSATLEEAE